MTANRAVVANFVRVQKTATANSVGVGNAGLFTITISNNSGIASGAKTMTDTLPAGMIPTGATLFSGPGMVSLAGSTVTWTGTLNAGQSAVVRIPYTMLAAGPQVNTAVVGTGSASYTVTGIGTDISVAKTSSATGWSPIPTPTVNEYYTLWVTNNTDIVAQNVVLEDLLPSGVTVTGAMTTGGYGATGGGSPTSSGSTISWSVGNLEAYAEVTLNYTLSFSAPGTYTNTVNVSTSTPENDLLNNTATRTVTRFAVGTTNISVSKTAAAVDSGVTGRADILFPNQAFRYVLSVSNYTESVAENVELSDVIPAGVIIDSVTVSTGTYNLTGQTLTAS